MKVSRSVVAALVTVALTLSILALFAISINQQDRDDLVLVAILVLAVLWVIAAMATVAFSRTRGKVEGNGSEWATATLVSPRSAAFVQFIGWLQRKR